MKFSDCPGMGGMNEKENCNALAQRSAKTWSCS